MEHKVVITLTVDMNEEYYNEWLSQYEDIKEAAKKYIDDLGEMKEDGIVGKAKIAIDGVEY